MIREYCNVPGLIGDKCKYSTFHRCISDIHNDIQKNHGDLKVTNASLENRIKEV